MSELRKLREEQSKKWLEETRIKDEIKAKEDEVKMKNQKKEEDKATKRKEENDTWRHERLHAEIASKTDSLEEANLMLEGHQVDFDFPLMKFIEGSLDFYKTPRIQEKYGLVRKADETKTETLLDPYSFHPDPLLPPFVPPLAPPIHEDDPLLQMAIHASLNT